MTTSTDTQRSPQPPADLNLQDSADYLGVSLSTVRRMISSGELPARRLAKRVVRIRVADLDTVGRPLGPGGR